MSLSRITIINHEHISLKNLIITIHHEAIPICEDEKRNGNICEAGFVSAIHVNVDMVAPEKC